MRLNGIAVTAFIKSHRRIVAIISDGAFRYDGKQLQRTDPEEFTKQFTGTPAGRCDGR